LKLSNEAKVGILIFLTLILGGSFAWFVGIGNPFGNTVTYYVTYNFAGGIEVGSPVRVSGIKVGRVERIDFFVPAQGDPRTAIAEPGSDNISDDKMVVPLRLKISVRKDVAAGVRKDSRFYVNMAGIIGERYVEITPGHFGMPAIKPGDTIAGVDPSRFDQLISQSFDLAGKISDIIQENKGDITKSIDLLYKLSGNINKTLEWVDKSRLFKTDLSKLVENLIAITNDVRIITDKTHTPEGEKTLALLHELLFRLEPLKPEVIRQFLQKEGVRVHIF
jgi:phospholipid/cholesterol/gamma-HCH transport system substrate-binding protein